jgi:DNA-binding NarL/FixJ family response regulator
LGRAVVQQSLSLLIADDDPGFRGVVRRMLEREQAARIVGEAADGEEALRLARALHPGVILMDIAMPRLNGLEALRRAKAELPGTKIIVVTVHAEEAYRRAALEHGADAFILKKALGMELVPVLRRLASTTRERS